MDTMKYTDSAIDERILRAVAEMGYENMTPIQEEAIPYLLEGKDIIGQAQTGTGKTAAFGIPLLQNVDPENHSLQAIVLCPTRELAIQAAEEIRKFSKYMHNIKMVPIYGGQDIVRQIKLLKAGAQIVIGTPGRVMDHMRRNTLKTDHVKLIVLDEADEMLNMGFREDMETILKEVPKDHQTALFSATMPKAILDITSAYQKDAILVKVAAKELTVPLIKQYYYVLKSQYKEEAISRLIEVYGIKRSIIFCNTKRMVDELAENLKVRGYQAEGLHGDLTQKQRDFVMNRFRNGNLEILIATDVAARGIDVDDLEAVFNYDVPQDIEYYVHRIGRTGRAGREGIAFTFAYGRDLYKIRDIERICKTKMTEMKVPAAEQVTGLKAEKVLKEATTATEGNLDRFVAILEKRIEETGETPMQIAAALLKAQMGEEAKDIVIDEPKKGNYGRSNGSRDSRSQGTRTGYGNHDGRGSRSGEGRSEYRGNRSKDSRDSRGSRSESSRDSKGYGRNSRTRDGAAKEGSTREGSSRVRTYVPGKDRKRPEHNSDFQTTPRKKKVDVRLDGSAI